MAAVMTLAGPAGQAMPALGIADDFPLPLAAVTETFAILGRRGSGKTTPQPRPDQRIYDAPPLILSRTADGDYIPVIEPWDPTRETAREAFARALIITHLAIEARKEREAAAAGREQELLALDADADASSAVDAL